MNVSPVNGMISLVLLLGLTLSPALVPAIAGDDIPADRLLPPEISLYVSIPSVPEFKDRWKKSLIGQLQQDPELTDFWKEIDKQLDEASAELKKNIGITLNELLSIPQGEVSFAVVQPPGKKMGVVSFLDYGKNQETINKLFDKADDSLAEQGAKKTIEEFEDTNIILYKKSMENEDSEDEGTPKKPDQEFAYFSKDSYLVVSNGVEVLKSVLTRWDGQHPKTFANNDVYRYIMERCRENDSPSLLVWYFNPIDFMRGAMAAAGPENVQAHMALGFLPALGVSNFKAIGGTFDMATEKYDSVSRTLAYVDFPSFGLLNVFQFPVKEQSPPEWVSAQTTGYFSVNWDIATAYAAIESMVDTFQGRGAFAKAIDQIATSEGGPNLHPRKDIIDQMTGRMHFINDLPDVDNPQSARLLVALGLKDADKMRAALTKIMKTPGIPATPRDFQGQTIFEFELGIGEHKAAIGITRNHLMIASDVTILEQTIRTDRERQSLAQSEQYQKIAQHFPAKTSIVGYQQQDAQIRAAYEQLRTGDIDALFPQFDFGTLPPFKTIQKYLQPTGTYVVPDEKGVLFVNFSLRR